MAENKRKWLLVLVRLAAVVVGLAAWFGTQHLIGARPAAANGEIGDALLNWLTPVHDYLMGHAGARNGLLIASSAVIDFLGVFLLLKSIFGKTVRPFLGLLMIFALRQICQAICIVPGPPGMIWPAEGPGFPSLLVTYGVSNDLFFSGHSALAVFGAVELARVRRWLWPVGIGIAAFEIFAVLALRAHWTMDVYAGAVTALLVAMVVEKMAPGVDRGLERLGGERILR